MAESKMYNMDIECKSYEENSESGRSEEIQTKMENIHTKEHNYATCYDDAESVNETATIPAITIKDNKQQKTDRNKYRDAQKILLLQIRDVLSSRMTSEKPTLFTIFNTNYRQTKIVGTIINIKSTNEKKITMLVDDGSGTISCIFENSDSDIKLRDDLEHLYKRVSELETVEKGEFHKLAELSDEQLFDNIGDEKNAFFNTGTKIFIEKLKKKLYDFPLAKDIKIGENVKMVGTVADYQNQRLIFVKHLKIIPDMTSYKYHLAEILAFKESLIPTTGKKK